MTEAQRQKLSIALRGKNSRLSAEQVREIRSRHRKGESQVSLAKLFGYSKTGISAIINRTNFGYLPD